MIIYLYSDERKPSRWNKSRNQHSNHNYEDNHIKKVSRFSDTKTDPSLDPLSTNTFAASYANDIYSSNYSVQVSIAPDVMSHSCSSVTNYNTITTVTPLLIPPPMSINIPPPSQMNNALLPPPNLVNQQLPGINVPPPSIMPPQNQIPIPPPCIQTVELTSIPAPNPIPVHSIPQPEPINTLAIPPPAPLQLQNIPSPSPIRLNEIPNPKPIDLLNIPAPGEEPKINKNLTNPEFIKNIPPPNKSVPPPILGTVTVSELPNIMIPPPIVTQAVSAAICVPQAAVIQPTTVPPPIHLSTTSTQLLNIINTNTGIPISTTSTIPALMAQPILPPMNLPQTSISIPIQTNVTMCQINVPPPVNVMPLPGPPPMLNQPPPMTQTGQLRPVNFPPPVQLPIVSTPNILDNTGK